MQISFTALKIYHWSSNHIGQLNVNISAHIPSFKRYLQPDIMLLNNSDVFL